MKVKTISTQSKDENGKPLYFIQDLDKIFKTEEEKKQYMQYLKRNKAARLLDFEIIEK